MDTLLVLGRRQGSAISRDGRTDGRRPREEESVSTAVSVISSSNATPPLSPPLSHIQDATFSAEILKKTAPAAGERLKKWYLSAFKVISFHSDLQMMGQTTRGLASMNVGRAAPGGRARPS